MLIHKTNFVNEKIGTGDKSGIREAERQKLG